jgi:hypothetical protein
VCCRLHHPSFLRGGGVRGVGCTELKSSSDCAPPPGPPRMGRLEHGAPLFPRCRGSGVGSLDGAPHSLHPQTAGDASNTVGVGSSFGPQRSFVARPDGQYSHTSRDCATLRHSTDFGHVLKGLVRSTGPLSSYRR